MKKYIFKSLLLVLVLFNIGSIFQGCSKNDVTIQNIEDKTISGIRTGILRQGLCGQGEFFECTDEQVFFMTHFEGQPMLYTGSHNDDLFKPVCSQDQCDHKTSSCDAWFESSGNVCYYGGHLFVNCGTSVYQINLDGSGREEILNLKDLYSDTYNGVANARLWNGVYTFYLTKSVFENDEINGWHIEQAKYDPYYFLLDGSMPEPLPMVNLISQYNDGNSFIFRGPIDTNHEKPLIYLDECQIYSWDPKSNSTELLFADSSIIQSFYTPHRMVDKEDWERSNPFGGVDMVYGGRMYEAFSEGYWGTDSAYFLKREVTDKGFVTNNLICKLTYSTASIEVLVDTGLEGSYKLCCFPDVIILCETDTNDLSVDKLFLRRPKLYFYNWDFELLGTLDFASILGEDGYLGVAPQNVICGETAQRIYIATRFNGVADFYIDKNEMITGPIILHPLEYDGVNLDAAYAAVNKGMDQYHNGYIQH